MSSGGASTHNLRMVLQRIDQTPFAIKNAAEEMMKFYSSGQTALAVTEWRNALHAAISHKAPMNGEHTILPFLYVANEVLQLSKRNRGNNFLDQFRPVLPSSLQFMCQADRSITEKVRRTCKIWGVSVLKRVLLFLRNSIFLLPGYLFQNELIHFIGAKCFFRAICQ
jgi:CID domain